MARGFIGGAIEVIQADQAESNLMASSMPQKIQTEGRTSFLEYNNSNGRWSVPEVVQAVQAERNLVSNLLAAEFPLEDVLPGLVGARQLVPQVAVLHIVHGEDCVSLQHSSSERGSRPARGIQVLKSVKESITNAHKPNELDLFDNQKGLHITSGGNCWVQEDCINNALHSLGVNCRRKSGKARHRPQECAHKGKDAARSPAGAQPRPSPTGLKPTGYQWDWDLGSRAPPAAARHPQRGRCSASSCRLGGWPSPSGTAPAAPASD